MSTGSAQHAGQAEVLAFWREAGAEKWFKKDEDFDADFRKRFLVTHEAAARGELDHWATQASGALALLILLDQFPRNAFRGTARMFATDGRAMAIARQAVVRRLDRESEAALRSFFYMPFMHSENLNDQERCIELCKALGNENTEKYALLHRDIIQRFGRFPHRNAMLGRSTTPGEQEFLDQGGFAG